MNQSSVVFALLAAFLFGASTPLAKLLIGDVPSVMLGGLLYLGSGVGLSIYRLVRDKSWQASRMQAGDVTKTLEVALQVSGYQSARVELKPRLLSDTQ